VALNAILVANHEAFRKDDFRRIAAEIERTAPELRCYNVWKDQFSPRAQAAQLLRPTHTILLTGSRRYWALRGTVARGRGGGKAAGLRLMREAGLPVPRWTEITPDTRLDPAEWGRWVVLKPSRGRRGQGVVIAGAAEVRFQPPESYPEGHAGRDGPMLAQRFVFTGRWPVHYRIVTCYGRPLYCARYEMLHELQAPLADAEGFDDGQPRSIPTSPRSRDEGGFTCSATTCDDADILALGRRAHGVFGEVPMIGFDIMRDANDGSLHIAEANQSNVWNLSGARGDAWRARGLDLYNQFGAIRVAAEAMADATRRLAR
jgi:hypothetical protein